MNLASLYEIYIEGISVRHMCTHVLYRNLFLMTLVMVFQHLTGQRTLMYPWRPHMVPVWILLALLCGVLKHLCQLKKLAGLPFLTSHPL